MALVREHTIRVHDLARLGRGDTVEARSYSTVRYRGQRPGKRARPSGPSQRDKPEEGVYRRTMDSVIRKLAMGLALVLVLAGCAEHYPADPHGTLERVTGGVLRVGVSHNEPFVSVAGPFPSGREVELVERYAATLDAEVQWTPGGEEELVDQLEHGRLDMLIGGLTHKTPWQQKAGLTRPYTETTDEFGRTHKHVLAVRKGENAFLLDLDTFLHQGGGQQ